MVTADFDAYAAGAAQGRRALARPRALGAPRPSATPPTWAGSPPTARSANMPGTSGTSRRAESSAIARRRPASAASAADIAAIVAGTPRRSLRGARPAPGQGGKWVARAFVPGAERVERHAARTARRLGELERRHDRRVLRRRGEARSAAADPLSRQRMRRGELERRRSLYLRSGARPDRRLLRRRRARICGSTTSSARI